MTDVEAKTPPKRKSVSNAENKKSSAKKPKLDNTKTPQKNNLTKQKFNKLNKNKSGDDSPKKLKPFGGTKTIDIKVKKSPKQTFVNNKGEEKKKNRRSKPFQILEHQIKTDKDEALKKIEDKIKAIESRDNITKSAKRKLKFLQRLRKIANGEPLGGPQQQQKAASSKSESTKRERKKNAKQLVAGTDLEKTSEKDSQQPDVKTNGKANKNKKVQKTILQKRIEEEDDSDEDVEEESDEDFEGEEDDSVDEEEVSEEGEEQDDDSDEGAEEEAESNDDEGAEEESDDDDEDESEEESPPPPPKVSNKKQKKK